jgi:hypothetical protein
MDDLIASCVTGLVVICAGTAVILFLASHLLAMELHAISTGDTGFILASLAALFILCAAYAGTGLWLRSTGRI